MRTRNHDWYDSIKNVPVYGVQVFHEGKWKHASIGGKPIWCATVEERDEQRKRLKRLLKLQEKMAMTANTRHKPSGEAASA